MAMTLRTDEKVDQALGRLAARWGVSKQAAALRAILEEDERQQTDVLTLSDQRAEKYAEALDRLGSV